MEIRKNFEKEIYTVRATPGCSPTSLMVKYLARPHPDGEWRTRYEQTKDTFLWSVTPEIFSVGRRWRKRIGSFAFTWCSYMTVLWEILNQSEGRYIRSFHCFCFISGRGVYEFNIPTTLDAITFFFPRLSTFVLVWAAVVLSEWDHDFCCLNFASAFLPGKKW